MGLKKLFKRRARNEVGKLDATASKVDETGHTVTSLGFDDATASEASGNVKVLTLESHARNGKWDAVVKLVQESHVDDWMTTSSEGSNSECSFHALHETTTPLHLALAHRAPVATIDALIEILRSKFEIPIPEESQDERGRTPLHVAVAAGCDEETVVRLLAGEGIVMPAVVRDANGQTALHTACATPIVTVKKKNRFAANPVAMQKWNKKRVMAVLMEEYPEATYVKDNAGKTPVDYAQEMGLKDSVAQHMERVCKEYLADLAPPPPEPANPHEMSTDLKFCEIPLIVPSKSGSCRNFVVVSSLELRDVSDEGIVPEPSDISTIGDDEAEILGSFDE